jgi:DNA-binding XRE family transcriptional regulator
MVTGRQIRAARGLLGWNAATLSEKSGVSRETINKIEDGTVAPREGTLSDIVKSFDENGIEFIENQGVRFKPQGVEIFEDTAGFTRFYDIVYTHLRDNGGTVCVSGVDESLYSKYRLNAEEHRKRMAELVKLRKDIHMQILVCEGDYNFVASTYAKYKWQSKEHFSPASFYVFGNNLALISFVHEPSPLVILIKSAPFADAYKQAFSIAWKEAIEPPHPNHAKENTK